METMELPASRNMVTRHSQATNSHHTATSSETMLNRIMDPTTSRTSNIPMTARPSNTVTINTALQAETTLRNMINTNSHTKANSNTVAGMAVSNSTLSSSPATVQQADPTTIKATAKIPTRHRTVSTINHHTASPTQHTAPNLNPPTELPNPAPKTAASWAP